MKKYLLHLSLLSSIIALPLIPNPSYASIVRSVDASLVSGESATRQVVKVWPGHGVSISFYNSGEIIKKIWFDDPSQFIVDVDGCLEGSNSKCSGDAVGAGLIHLRKIDAVKIPGLPKASSYGSHLTVVTELNGSKKVYHFNVVPGNGTPEYSQIAITGSSRNDATASRPQPVDYTAQSDSKYIARGMTIAMDKKWISTDTQLWGKLTKLVELRSQGIDLTLAAANTGVSMKVVEKLMLMGGKRYIEMPPLQPQPSQQENDSPQASVTFKNNQR